MNGFLTNLQRKDLPRYKDAIRRSGTRAALALRPHAAGGVPPTPGTCSLHLTGAATTADLDAFWRAFDQTPPDAS